MQDQSGIGLKAVWTVVFKLRPYQTEAVDATVSHFRISEEPAVIVLPTGAGKSLVIARLADVASGRVLVLAHVKELVAQNHDKYCSYGNDATLYSVGLRQKSSEGKVVFASVQSVAANLDAFSEHYSLLIIDECHRVSDKKNSQYGKVIQQLREQNPRLRLLGLTATPYRMGMGWIYKIHYRGFVRSDESRPFSKCIYELPLSTMVRQAYLTKPEMMDMPVAQYDFSQLDRDKFGCYARADVNRLLVKHRRVTQSIVEQIVELSERRQGVMIFASTVEHANEIHGYLPEDESFLITGDTPQQERDTLIIGFKQRHYKFLVNVSVLTTGFDAPHVDLIVIMRATESVSLFQQIVGRGLRLCEGKDNCLVIDYAGNGFNLYHPEVGEKKPKGNTEPVQVFCPVCEFPNIFWGITDDEGTLIEHFGRRCHGLVEHEREELQCDFRFRFKECPECNWQNDIAARSCHDCGHKLIDPDDQLRAALQLKNALILRCSGMTFGEHNKSLKIEYHDEDGTSLIEFFNLENHAQRKVFNRQFGSRYKLGLEPKEFKSISELLSNENNFVAPDFIVARKQGHHWRIQEKIFDYDGRYRKANQLVF